MLRLEIIKLKFFENGRRGVPQLYAKFAYLQPGRSVTFAVRFCGGRWGATSKTMVKRRSAAAAKASGPPPRALFFMHTSIESASTSRMASASAGRRRAVAPTIPDARDWHAVSQAGAPSGLLKKKAPPERGLGLGITKQSALCQLDAALVWRSPKREPARG